MSDEEYLLRRKRADRRGASIQLRRAVELLLARVGPDRPNARVRVFRVMVTLRSLLLKNVACGGEFTRID